MTDIARDVAGHERVFGAGTLIDSLRLGVHIGRQVGVGPAGVDAMVVGEYGKSSATLWSSATVAGVPVSDLLALGSRPRAGSPAGDRGGSAQREHHDHLGLAPASTGSGSSRRGCPRRCSGTRAVCFRSAPTSRATVSAFTACSARPLWSHTDASAAHVRRRARRNGAQRRSATRGTPRARRLACKLDLL